MASSQLLSLCRFLCKARLGTTPSHVIDHTKLVLLDTLGVIMAGARTAEMNLLADRLPGIQRKGKSATCPGRTGHFDPLWAALINGMGGSSLEFEEGNSAAMGHPAVQIVPAVLAECEVFALPGENLIMGVLCGYEAASRISRASSIRKGLHPTGTWGTVGSALGVGCSRQKSPEALHQVANIAASYAFSSYVKNSFAGKNVASTFAGLVNYIGVLANRFQEVGIEADEGSLEMTFSRFLSEHFNPEILVSNLGDEYAITENYFKPYPTCRFTHPALDALKSLTQQVQIAPENVAGVKVVSFRAAVHASTQPPENIEAMRFSLPYLIAVTLIYGHIDLETMKEDLVRDPFVKELASKVEMVLSPEYEQARPRKNPAMVTIRLKDGQELSHEAMHCLGDPFNPMPREALASKFLDLAGPVIGKARGKEFLEKLQGLESVKNIRPLMRMLRAGA